jgi:hypothetical protein
MEVLSNIVSAHLGAMTHSFDYPLAGVACQLTRYTRRMSTMGIPLDRSQLLLRRRQLLSHPAESARALCQWSLLSQGFNKLVLGLRCLPALLHLFLPTRSLGLLQWAGLSGPLATDSEAPYAFPRTCAGSPELFHALPRLHMHWARGPRSLGGPPTASGVAFQRPS